MVKQLFERISFIMVFFPKILLGLGLACFLAGQLYMTVYPMLQRDLPIEPDDAYAYIVKAAQIEDCFFQDCKALTSLRETLLIPAEGHILIQQRWTALVRTHGFSIPLYAFFLQGIHQLGVSYEAAYSILSVIGIVLICIGAAALLLAFFTPGPVGVALILMSTITFRGQGLHSIVPSNFTLGIALCIWAYLYTRKTYRHWLVFGAMLIMALLHPVGAVLNAITIGIYITQYLLDKKPLRDLRFWSVLGAGLLILAAELILPNLIEYPMLYFTNPPTPQSYTFLNGFVDNINAAVVNVTIFAKAFFHPVFFFVMLFFGFIWLDKKKAIRLGVALITFFGALFVSFFYVTTFPGLLFERLWIVVAFLLIGVLGNGIFSLFTASLVWLSQRKFPVPQYPKLQQALSKQSWIVISVLTVAVMLGLYSYTGYYTHSFTINLNNKIQRGNNSYDEGQVDQLLHTLNPEDVVVYNKLTPMLYFLTHGALHADSLYAPALLGSPLENEHLAQNNEIRFVVSTQPLLTSQWGEKGVVVLNSDTTLELEFNQSVSSGEVQFLFEDTAQASSIMIRQGESSMQLEIPEGDSGWLSVDLMGNSDSILVDFSSMKSAIRLGGLRLSEAQITYWPWDWGLVLRISERDVTFEYDFSSEPFFPYSNSTLTVLADHGTTVLLEVKWAENP